MVMMFLIRAYRYSLRILNPTLTLLVAPMYVNVCMYVCECMYVNVVCMHMHLLNDDDASYCCTQALP